MNVRFLIGLILGGWLLAACASAVPTSPTVVPLPVPSSMPAPTATPKGGTFVADIQPIFNERCIKCHSGENPPRGLRLDTYGHVLAGGTYRAVILPGDPDGSELVRRIRGEAVPRMPFDGPPFLSEEQIHLIETWIALGAPERCPDDRLVLVHVPRLRADRHGAAHRGVWLRQRRVGLRPTEVDRLPAERGAAGSDRANDGVRYLGSLAPSGPTC